MNFLLKYLIDNFNESFLSPKPTQKKINIEIRPGNVILSSAYTKLSCFLIPSKYNHAAFVYGRGLRSAVEREMTNNESFRTKPWGEIICNKNYLTKENYIHLLNDSDIWIIDIIPSGLQIQTLDFYIKYVTHIAIVESTIEELNIERLRQNIFEFWNCEYILNSSQFIDRTKSYCFKLVRDIFLIEIEELQLFLPSLYVHCQNDFCFYSSETFQDKFFWQEIWSNIISNTPQKDIWYCDRRLKFNL